MIFIRIGVDMWEKIKALYQKLISMDNQPENIALGAALGAFISILPLYGLHTVLVIVAALLIPRANKLAMLIGTNVSLPPTVPVITWAGYEIGRRVLYSSHYPPLNWKFFSSLSWQKIGDFYWPLFVGSVVLGSIVAVVMYLSLVTLLRKLRKQ